MIFHYIILYWLLHRDPSNGLFLRKLQQPLEHTPDPELPVFEGNLFIFVFLGTWGLFHGSVGFFLDDYNPHITG